MFSDLLYRLRSLFCRNRMEQDLDEEVRFHFEQQVERNIHQGMSRLEATRQARLLFGGVDEVKEECRDARGVSFIESTWQDLRYAARRLRKSPGFTLIAVLSLTLGIGANSAIFSLVDAILLRSLPVENPEQLELVRRVSEDSAQTNFTYPLYREIRDLSDIFSGAIGRVALNVNVVVDGRPSRRTVELATGNYFSVLGVTPIVGRLLNEKDDRSPRGHPVAVLSFRFWRETFLEDLAVVGRTVQINDQIYSVVGVAPAGFFGVEVGTSPDVWIPSMQAEDFVSAREAGKSLFDSEIVSWLTVVARRKPGVSREQAEVALNVLYQRLHAANASEQRRPTRYSMDLMPGSRGFSRLRGTFDNPLFVLMVLVALVLALACANVSNLLLGRYATRCNEIEVRLALGAGRGRLIRQLLAESVLLGFTGAASGALLSLWGVRILVGFLPTDHVPLPLQSVAELRVWAFTAAISCLAILVFGLVPAWSSVGSNASSCLHGQKQFPALHGHDLRKVLVVVQAALALLLVLGGSLFAQSLRKMERLDLGLDTDNVLMAMINPKQSGYLPEQTNAFFEALALRLRAMPGVQAVGFTFLPLLEGNFLRDGEQNTEQDDPGALSSTMEVSDEFFSAVGMTLLRGRTFGPQDTAGSPRVSVINETAARYYFPGEDPLGKPAPILRTAGEIIGIVRDARLHDVHEAPRSDVYMSAEQRGGMEFQQTIYIRTQGDAASYGPILQQIVSELDDRLPLFNVKTFAAQKDEALARERLVATLTGFFAVLSLLLAAIGIYGVVAYSVVVRTREIGVHVALGAQRGAVVWMIQRDALTLTAFGIVLGIPLSLALFHLLESQLFGIEPNDPATLGATIAILTAVAVVAALMPARRALCINPATVLKAN